MDSFANVFDDMVILSNAKLVPSGDTVSATRTWLKRLSDISPSYEPSAQFDSNKTLIFGYPSANVSSTHVLALDVYLTTATVVVPLSFSDFTDAAMLTIVKYLVGTIRTMVSYECANELRFRLSVYIPIQHTAGVSKLRYSPYFTTNAERPTKTIFGRPLPAAMCRFDLDFTFNEDWSLRTQKKTFLDFNAVGASAAGLKLF
jgi:hypothetical protein